MEPKEVERRFADWVNHVCPALKGRVIAIDGKSVRGSGSVVRGVKPLHLVSAYATEEGVMLGQQGCEEKSNEITAIRALLPSLALKGAIVTIGRRALARGNSQAGSHAQVRRFYRELPAGMPLPHRRYVKHKRHRKGGVCV